MHIRAKSNDYASQLKPILDTCPKSVIAAIAVSLLSSGGEEMQDVKERFAAEWDVLYKNGIVPQQPSKVARMFIQSAD